MKTEQPQAVKESLKDSTNAVPMIPLKDALEFVYKIHEQALEAESMVVVAKGLGYAGNTSTGFYRRVVAARLFGILSPSGASLTKRANDYFRPDSDDSKQNALLGAITGIPPYCELLSKYEGKKINPELVGNSMGKSLKLTLDGAQICAATFVASIKFSGLLSSDGIVTAAPAATQNATVMPSLIPQSPSIERQTAIPDTPAPDEVGSHTFVLPLDREKKRKITVTAPLDVTTKEIERIKAWLAVSLNIDGDTEGNGL